MTTINHEIHSPGVRVREAREGDAPSRTITGYAVVFGQRSVNLGWDDEDPVYEIISRDAITRELLDSSDIKMTMFHNREILLARSNRGSGSLTYSVDDTGVSFEFEAPETSEGEKALQAVKRGDISGCSFAFTLDPKNRESFFVSEVEEDGKKITLVEVREIAGIHDFTLASDPAYPQTEVAAECREIAGIRREGTRGKEGMTVRMERDISEIEGIISAAKTDYQPI